MKKIYAVTGRARSGKDTVADYIAFKLNCNKYALATPLKDLVCSMLNISMEQLDKYKNEKWELSAEESIDFNDVDIVCGIDSLNVSFRSILQKCGDEMKAFFGIDCFMKKLHMKMLEEQNDCSVISDVRLLEEQKWLAANTNPVFIKIVRDTEDDKDSGHRTESEVDSLGYDILISNNGTIDELYEKIDKIIK